MAESIDSRTTNAFTSKTVRNASTNQDFDTASENQLNKYASYVPVFTLSALSRDDLDGLVYNKKTYTPTNVIARTGGIQSSINIQDNGLNFNNDPFRVPDAVKGNYSDGLTLKKEDRAKKQQMVDYAKSVLARGFDLFIERVNVTTIPLADPSRQFTAVSSIRMEISEPLGLSFITKLRGAANNSGFVNHVGAPYLLSIEFKGLDTEGNVITIDATRRIPIQITQMEVQVNQGGSSYSLQAVPFNESGFFNKYNIVRAPMKIKIENEGKLSDYCKAITKALNRNIEAEKNAGYFGQNTEDKYLVTCDPKLDKKFIVDNTTNVRYSPMGDLNAGEDDTTLNNNDKKKFQTSKKKAIELSTIDRNTGISQHLLQVMKLVDPYHNDEQRLKDWATKANGEISDSIDKLISPEAKAKFVADNEEKFYIDFFRITTNIKYLNPVDIKTKTHQKIIHFHIEPVKIHILNYTQPGLHSKFRSFFAMNRKFVARKKYKYIFSGENTEIMDLNLNYNVAYYSPRFVALQQQQIGTTTKPLPGKTGNANDDVVVESELPNNSYPSSSGKTANTGVIGVNEGFDQFADAFSNPEGDMNVVELTVRGDPAYLSANQFNSLKTPDLTNIEGPGVWVNVNNGIYQVQGSYSAYDDKTNSYNLNLAEPYVGLEFRFPVDIDDNTGMYKLNTSERVPFNGLYRVTKIENSFDLGQFTQILTLTRFRNQGEKVGTPVFDEYTKTRSGNIPVPVKNFREEYKKYFDFADNVADGINKVIEKLRKIKFNNDISP
jgi:hypothetical protein